MDLFDIPIDFEEYWNQVLQKLNKVPLNAKEILNPLHSNEFCKCYEVFFLSYDYYQLFGYLSIPFGKGPFPAIFSGSSYRSAVEPLFQGEAKEKRGRFVIFSAASRGQRNADKQFVAKYPGLFTEGIESPNTYVYLKIIGDWLRGIKYLVSRPEIDRKRIIVAKHNSLPIIAGSLCPDITHVVAKPGCFAGIHDKNTEELNDYLRMYPNKNKFVLKTLSYFNLKNFCKGLRARTLLLGPEQPLKNLASNISGKTDIKQSEQSQFKDGLFEEEWIAHNFGFSDPIIPSCWR